MPDINDLSDNSVNALQDELQSSFLSDLARLKVKSKRGRPRKFKQHPLNKSFRIPRKKKIRGEGLQQVTHCFLNNSHDEADAIYEIGLLMGLLPINSKEESMDLIRKNLAY